VLDGGLIDLTSAAVGLVINANTFGHQVLQQQNNPGLQDTKQKYTGVAGHSRDNLPAPTCNPTQPIVIPFQRNQPSSQPNARPIQPVFVAKLSHLLPCPHDLLLNKIVV